MVEIRAVKKIGFERIYALLDIYSKENRPDIRWLLQNYNNRELFHEGEIRTFKKLLVELYGVLTMDGDLTEQGRALLEGKDGVFVPGHGVYELVLYYDFIKKQYLAIDFDLLKETNARSLKGDKDFEPYQDLEDVEFTTWRKDDPTVFKLRFIRGDSVPTPRIEKRATIDGEVIITATLNEKNSQCIEIKSDPNSGRNYYYVDNNFDKLDVDRLLLEIDEWDPKRRGILKNFSEIRDEEPIIINTFETSYEFPTERQLYFLDDVEDDDLYTVEVNKIPVIPRTLQDAQEWTLFLFLEKARKFQKKYVSLESLRQELSNDLGSTPLMEHYPKAITSLSDHELLKHLFNNNKEAYYRVQAMRDLSGF